MRLKKILNEFESYFILQAKTLRIPFIFSKVHILITNQKLDKINNFKKLFWKAMDNFEYQYDSIFIFNER